MDKVFFDSWDAILRTLILSVCAYIGLIIFLRISGKRTLSKMNAFDLVITVAFGSTLASTITSKQVSLTQSLTAMAMLVLLQFIVTFLSVRSSAVTGIVKGTPSLLLYKGDFLWDAMKRERFIEQEIRAAVRESGVGSIKEVYAVVLETDGSLSVIPDVDGGEFDAFANVRAPESIKLTEKQRNKHPREQGDYRQNKQQQTEAHKTKSESDK